MAVLPDPARRAARSWSIRSVVVRARDGPYRVAQVYRLLLADSGAALPAAAAPRTDQPSPGAACATRQKEPADDPAPPAPGPRTCAPGAAP